MADAMIDRLADFLNDLLDPDWWRWQLRARRFR